MYSVRTLLLWSLFPLLVSCTDRESNTQASTLAYDGDTVNAAALEDDFMAWWSYFNDHIVLSGDFVALDTARNTISKDAFLHQLTSGAYIPVKLVSRDTATYLQLHPLSQKADDNISQTIRNQANTAYQQYSMEGSAFPDFEWVSLDGQQYDKESTAGKYLVVKCWFIACGACIQEFPELNQLVAENRHRDDVAFVSLAYDSPEALSKFMAKRDFGYSVVPVDRDFLETELKVYNYPTHFVIDQRGIIRKVVNSAAELKTAIRQIL